MMAKLLLGRLHRNWNWPLWTRAVLPAIMLLAGCGSLFPSLEEQTWRECRSFKSQKACSDYLEYWPNGERRMQVLAIVEEILPKNCTDYQLLSACGDYRRLFPNGRLTREVKRVQAGAAWPQVRQEDSIGGYLYFLSLADRENKNYAFVVGRLGELRKVDDEAWRKTKSQGTLAAYAEYTKQHPFGEHFGEAQKHLDDAKMAVELKVQAAAQRRLEEQTSELVNSVSALLTTARTPRSDARVVVIDRGEHGKAVTDVVRNCPDLRGKLATLGTP